MIQFLFSNETLVLQSLVEPLAWNSLVVESLISESLIVQALIWKSLIVQPLITESASLACFSFNSLDGPIRFSGLNLHIL